MDEVDLYKQATKLESLGQYKEAVSIYKKITTKSKDPRLFIAYGICLQKLGHWKLSVSKLEKGLALNPHYGESDTRLFLADSFLKLSKKSKAIQQWRIVSKMKSEYPGYEYAQNKA